MLDKTRKPLFPQLGKELFWKKFDFFSFGKSRLVPKKRKINIHSVAKYQITRRGDPLETLKKFEKNVAHCRKKSLGRNWHVAPLLRLAQ